MDFLDSVFRFVSVVQFKTSVNYQAVV